MFRVGDRISGQVKRPATTWGAQQKQDFCLFRLYCPKAIRITLVLFDHYEDTIGSHYPMERLDDGNWHLKILGCLEGKYYAYRIEHTPDEKQPQTPYLIADPWSKEVATTNHYLQFARSKITPPDDFDWQGDTYVIPSEHRDLVIYETHLKDLTAHPSSGSTQPGTYSGMVEKGITGGIQHLKKLGINAVEFLPLQKFAYFEPPYLKETPEGYLNTWNPYSRNYWGYMTSFYFAPETMYASDGSSLPGDINGTTGNASRELKEMIRELHKEGITVILDVVYNHVSQYDLNPLKYLNKPAYFRSNEEGYYTSDSGCGNDLKTEAAYIRELIVSSIIWWMKEYHIDGFRFDLGNLIDRQTIAEIHREAIKINPHVLLIAEPWGGGYDPSGFSEMGWASWNDQIRNGVKGIDPVHSPGFIFGKWHHESHRESLENYIRGTLLYQANGLYHHSGHSINYLESHDGYTLGDFIRIALDPSKSIHRFTDKSELIALNRDEEHCARLAALFLFCSQGIPMIHAGQEWGRSKWIDIKNTDDPNHGKLDHNSYEKDNETNYLDFEEIEENRSLVEYYTGLIGLRKSFPQLRRAHPNEITFRPWTDALHMAFEIHCKKYRPEERLLVCMNGHREQSMNVELPDGPWEVLADGYQVFPSDSRPFAVNHLIIPPSTGAVLVHRAQNRSNGVPR
ncbi:alpha-amylase family glycosyl hydrolase [Balneolaceae bacterium ANBcel3]|nr:alpha-amylase family glycosyl hydrolase [Balneolaceae bacterium ANBcel3]